EDVPLQFSGVAEQANAAELSAAAAAVAALPPPPAIEPRYPKPQDAAAWVSQQLLDKQRVELDSTMADVLPTLAHLPTDLQAAAPLNCQGLLCCATAVWKRLSHKSCADMWKDVRSVLVSRKTHGSKLAAALRARLLGEDGGESYPCLELKMAGKSACKEAAIATKILQRSFKAQSPPGFAARFEQFEGYRARGLVLTIVRCGLEVRWAKPA
ncbi:unnamed protein product, partial [Symbiodinium pilosum]